MNAAATLIAYLEQRGVPCALIGGIALSAHGITRATLDVDVLVADPAALDAAFWAGFVALGVPEIRRGDAEDPLAGVVRFVQGLESIDVVVGRAPWTSRIIGRKMFVTLGKYHLPVVDRADLVLLKLFAGGPQDLVDVELLVAASPELRAAVRQRLDEAPPRVGALWREKFEHA